MRYSLLAGGKRIRPGARARDRARGRPRRGRRCCRSPPRSSSSTPTRSSTTTCRRWTTTTCAAAARRTTRSTARTSRSSPATGCTPRRSATCSTHQDGEPRAPARRARRARGRDRRQRHGRRAVARRRRPADADLRALHALKTGRLIGASVECVLLVHGLPSAALPRRSPTSSACCSRSSTTSSTSPAPTRRSASHRALTNATANAPTSASSASSRRVHWPRQSHERARAALAEAAPGGSPGARADHRLHPTPGPHEPRILDRIDRPQDLHALSEDELDAGRPGGPRAHHRHGRRDRRALRREPRHVRAGRRAALAARLAAATRSSGTSATRPTRTRSSPAGATSCATIRQYEGLAPFCAIHESEHDIMGAGHASTSIGYAVGLKEGMQRARRADDAGKVVAVIGDGAMTGGVAFEAIHQAGGLGTPMVVVLNDNGMSISPNVGALSRYFNRVRLNPKLWHAREGVEARAHRAARRHRRGVRAPRPAAQGVDQGVLGSRACSGRSSTGRTWASSTATTRARCARR